MVFTLLALLLALPPLSSGAPQLLRIAGSSTVFPVASRWGQALQQNYTFVDSSGRNTVCTSKSGVANFTLCGGGSSTGARRVCAPRDDPSHVDIGDMSRDWKDSEAVRLDDGYTLECLSSKIRVTQLVVGADGLAVVVAKNGPAHDCLLAMGGLTLAQLRWMFSDWDDATLVNDKDGGVDLASVVPNDNNNGIKEWRDLNSQCAELPINTYGAGSESGTFSFFGEVVLCKKCFGGKSGYTAEGFSSCSASDIHTLEHLSTQAEIDSFMQTQRRPNCYMPSEDDHKILQWALADTKGIAYFGYAYYAENSASLTVSPIADDRVNGAADTTDAFIMPTTYTITDGSYSVFRRSLFMNVDNQAWPLVKDYLALGYSDAGLAMVASAGYVVVNTALRAKMQQRVEEGGNPSADYITLPPAQCAPGTELSQEPFMNRFGRPKVNYTCKACPPGRSKRASTPTPCRNCTEGSFQGLVGQTDCSFALPGEFAGAGAVSSTPCPINTAASSPGQAACAPCDHGFFTLSTGATTCERCDLGKYRDGNHSECVACPAGMTTEFRAADAPQDCACASGTYQQRGDPLSAPCSPCPEGMTCAFGSRIDNFADWTPQNRLPTPLLMQHYWSDPASPLSVYSCKREDAGCPGGQPGSCSGGRVDLLCGVCPEGLAWSKGECRPCNKAFVLTPFLAPFVVLGLLCGTYYLANSPLRADVSVGGAISLTFGQLITIAQILSVYNDLNVAWPRDIADVYKTLSVSTGSAEALSLECAMGSNAMVRYVVRCSLPLDLLVMIALLYLGSHALASLVRQLKPWSIDKSINTAAQILQAVFIGVAAIVVVPLQCYPHPNGRSSMAQYPEVLCWGGGEHTVLVTLAAAVALLFVAPFVAYCLYGTRKVVCIAHGSPAYGRSLTRFRFLLFRFREDTWWWGNVFMARQLLLAFAPSLPAETPHTQCIFIVIVLTLYGFLEAHYWPWKAEEFNVLDIVITCGLVMVITTSTVLFEQPDDTGGYIIILTILIVCLLLSSTLLSVYIVGSALSQRSVASFGKDAAVPFPVVAQVFYRMCEAIVEQGEEPMTRAIADMSYYDRQSLRRCAVVCHASNTKSNVRKSFGSMRELRLVQLGRYNSTEIVQKMTTKHPSIYAGRSLRSTKEEGEHGSTLETHKEPDSFDDLGVEVPLPLPFRSKWAQCVVQQPSTP